MPDPTLIIAAISAALQAVRTWISMRDVRKTDRRARTGYRRTAEAKLAREQGGRLKRILPADILSTIEKRIDTCWDRYRLVINPDTGSTAREIDEATQDLKRCICTELKRIYDLNGSIPAGKLREWWELYCQKR